MRKVETVLDVILEAVAVDGTTVIDVGCGTGEVARALAGRGARVIGIDESEMLSRIENHGGTAQVEFLEGGAEGIPVDDASADLVLFVASLHHVQAPGMRRAETRPDRVLSLEIPVRTGRRNVFGENIRHGKNIRRRATESYGIRTNAFI